MQVVAAGALRGAGDVRAPFLAVAGAHWLIGFPLALFFCFGLGWGASGPVVGVTGGLITVSIVLGARFLVVSARTIERV